MTITKIALPFPWTCPHCNRATTISGDLYHRAGYAAFVGESKHGHLGLYWSVIRCPNTECNDVAVLVTFGSVEPQSTGSDGPSSNVPIVKALVTRSLWPEGSALPQPDYIPKQIRNDYYEACLIRDLSPKAAATLARRCLQGIVRDFWKISKGTLAEEIAALRGKVGTPLWDAIDAVRKVGNIGAHMEKDINRIIDIEPEEATRLIGLVEILFKEWYVARHEREETLKELIALGSQKAKERKIGSGPF